MSAHTAELVPKNANKISGNPQSGMTSVYWTELQFGNYHGKTLPQILFCDPDWFFHVMDNGYFKNKGALLSQAEDINYKARNIKIPNNEAGGFKVENFIHPSPRKFSDFVIIPADQQQHVGSSPTIIGSVIDMSIPRQISEYDKLGNKNLVASLKSCLFGNRSKRMSKKLCEEFFNDSSNFSL